VQLAGLQALIIWVLISTPITRRPWVANWQRQSNIAQAETQIARNLENSSIGE
jgi:hypothetical protein